MTAHLNDYEACNRGALVQSEDKRKHFRFSTQLKALYYLGDEHEGLEKCDILNVSHGGIGIEFKKAGTVKDSSAINLGIVVKWHFMPISLKGTVKWLGESLDHLICGIELTVPLDNMTLLKLL